MDTRKSDRYCLVPICREITQIEQQTAFPDEEGSTLVISPEKGKKEGKPFVARMDIWEALRLSVNGKRQNVTVKAPEVGGLEVYGQKVTK